MSDEENQENLSVEDILSSIKNILVDENGNPIEEETVEKDVETITPPKEEPIESKEETPTNDVFNLDDSMIIPEEAPSADISDLLESTEEDNISLPSLETENKNAETQEVSDVDSLLENTVTQKPEENEVTEETIDASVNIINNFAKVFAEKQQARAQQPELPKEEPIIAENVQSSIESLGITDMVKETIVTQVKNSLDSHFEQIASDIIASQTKTWLNENLASIVEKTVAKEIERVIAKVGS